MSTDKNKNRNKAKDNEEKKDGNKEEEKQKNVDEGELIMTKFGNWFAQLHDGFNILCYGLGSKRKMLTLFAKRWLKDGPVIVINGYYPDLKIETVKNNFYFFLIFIFYFFFCTDTVIH